ncbi:MAG: substrate-binding domain-containing protein [Pseudomonadota bacterium]
MTPCRTARRARRLAFILALLAALPASAQQLLRLSTTTSTDSSGLLQYLLPEFEAQTKIHVQVIAVGSGKALELAKNGDVDVTLVHARAAEDKFVADGHGVDRRDVMHNDFVIVGPAFDPAGIKGGADVLVALRKIAASGARFISRGDNSGTEQMEQSYWKQLGSKPQGHQYVSAGLGMGEVLNMASQLAAYTLSDRATYAAYRQKTGLAILCQGDPKMFNPYGIIAVNPAKYPDVNYAGAQQLIKWITSPHGQQRIAAFKAEGQQVFFPDARK